MEFLCSMEFDDRDAVRFPKIRLLRPDAEKSILRRIARYVCKNGIAGFPIFY